MDNDKLEVALERLDEMGEDPHARAMAAGLAATEAALRPRSDYLYELAAALYESRELWQGSVEAPAVREVTARIAAAMGFDVKTFFAAAGYRTGP